MKFKTLQEKLSGIIWKEMHNGGLTGTALARQAGLGQAHISNFLNGKRGLSIEAMDRVLAARHLSVLDLLDADEIDPYAAITAGNNTKFQDIPLVAESAAASASRITRSMAREIMKLPRRWLANLRPACARARSAWERFVFIRVEAREGMNMFPRLMPGATVLIDRHYNSAKPYRREELSMFLVRKPDKQCALRYIELLEGNVILRPHNHAYPVEILVPEPKHSLSDYIVGRVAYVSIET